MRSVVVVLLAATTSLLAGCASPQTDFSRESLLIGIRVQEGPVEVAVPLWLADGGATAQDWADAFEIHGPGAFALATTIAGPAIVIRTDATTSVEAVDVRSSATGAHPRAYLDGDYSLGSSADAPIAIQSNGRFELTWSYEGTSDGCSLFINQSWLQPDGVAPAYPKPFGGRSPPPDCVD